LGVPCTNCVAFSIECKIPTPKRKKTTAGKAKDSDRYVIGGMVDFLDFLDGGWSDGV
jgi:hypothetical protein